MHFEEFLDIEKLFKDHLRSELLINETCVISNTLTITFYYD